MSRHKYGAKAGANHDLFGILNRGQIIPMTHFTLYAGKEMRASYKAAKGQRFVFLLLGVEGREGEAGLDARKVLKEMGWRNPAFEDV